MSYDNKFSQTDIAYAAEGGIGVPLSPRQMSKRERLVLQKRAITEQLRIVDEALALLDQYPELEKFTDALQKAGV